MFILGNEVHVVWQCSLHGAHGAEASYCSNCWGGETIGRLVGVNDPVKGGHIGAYREDKEPDINNNDNHGEK